jgi:photosystem II stability/assembly factor-like uncharacterized protein
MRTRIIITIAAFTLLRNTPYAQWTTVYQDVDAQFYDAAFPTDQIGFVIASDSGGTVVLRTTDGGTTWNKRYLPGLSFVNKIAMLSPTTGYIIKGGAPGKILKTTDGFNTYITYNTDSSFVVQSLCPLTDSMGFYLNNASRLRKFENNGSSITHINDTLMEGQTLQFVNSNIGYLDAGYALIKTTNAGASWNYVNNNLGFYCTKFGFGDPFNGYFSNDTVIYRTNNGGISFSLPYTFPHAYSFAINGSKCMAANDTGNVTFTMNGGINWQNETTGINMIAPEPYTVISTPGGQYFLFSQFSGEIRKRSAINLDVPTISMDHDVKIYPNPFTTQTTISFQNPQTNTLIRISDLLGREIKTIRFSGQELTIQRNDMVAGTYIITLVDQNNRQMSAKIIIN